MQDIVLFILLQVIKLEEIFITTKGWVQDFGYEATKAVFQTSLNNLGVDNINLCLLRQACGDYYSVRRAFEELYDFAQLAYRALDTMKEFNVLPMACGPLDERKHNIFNHPLFSKIHKNM